PGCASRTMIVRPRDSTVATQPQLHPALMRLNLSISRSLPTKWQCDPNGIRTRVTAVKGRCPGPLDDRVTKARAISELPLIYARQIGKRYSAGRRLAQTPYNLLLPGSEPSS